MVPVHLATGAPPSPPLEQPDEDLAIGVVTDDRPQLVIYYTLLCNAACDHCVVESGPGQAGKLAAAAARQAIEAARRSSAAGAVVFTGGESFIYLEEILELCRFARGLGLRTRVVTNGYWARTPELAARMLERLAGEGLDELFVSFDEFHLPFIDPQRVFNVFRGAAEAECFPYLLYSTVVRTDPESMQPVWSKSGFAWPRGVADALATYGFPLEICVPQRAAHAALERLSGRERETFKESMTRDHALVAWQTLSLGGRATRLLSGEIESRPIEDGAGAPCPVAGRLLTVSTAGRLFPCCSVWSNSAAHGFGTFATVEEFQSRQRAMESDPFVRLIHDQGPGRMIRHLRGKGHSLPERYTDICHMCEHLLARHSLDELRAEARELRASPRDGD